MSLVKWNDMYTVRVMELDEHHKKLIGFINQIDEALNMNKDCSKILKELKDYTIFHFSKEEEYMKKVNFPEYNQQKTQHDMFIKQVEKYDNKKETLSADTVKYLKDWLIKHILGCDKKYGAMLNAEGVK